MALIVIIYVMFVILLKKRYCAKNFYYAGLIILIGFLVPFRLEISINVPLHMPDYRVQLNDFFEQMPLEENFNNAEEKIANVSYSNLFENKYDVSAKIMVCIWLMGMSIVLAMSGIRHIRFINLINRWGGRVTDKRILKIFEEEKIHLNITRNIELKEVGLISSPMLISIFKPVIYIPNYNLKEEEFRFIFAHELIHYKRHDLVYKYLLVLITAIHWFNPAVYLFAKLFMEYCELSCDEQVTTNLNKNQRYKYALLIINMAEINLKSNTALLNYFNSGKNNMKNRISFIMESKKKSISTVMITSFILITLSTGTVFAATNDSATTVNIKTDEEIAAEMEEAFKEEFSNEFNVDDFVGMTISYDEDGIPIVTDNSNTIKKQTVMATTRYGKSGFYSSSKCNSSNLVFYIIKGESVEVIDSAYTTTVVKVKYAGKTGYMKKSQLKF